MLQWLTRSNHKVRIRKVEQATEKANSLLHLRTQLISTSGKALWLASHQVNEHVLVVHYLNVIEWVDLQASNPPIHFGLDLVKPS